MTPFSREDILADDWEIQEPTVTITRAQFWTAAKDCLSASGWVSNGPDGPRFPISVAPDELAKKLGLE
jgi:hypothetical protein